MTEPIVYDKAKYHYDGDFPDDLPIEQGFVHTGMFLGWIIEHRLYSELFAKDLDGYISAFKARKMTGAQVFEACDGVLMADMLSEEGNSFARYYFNLERGKYLADYSQLFAARLPTIYHVEDSWLNFHKLTKRIDRRYRIWKIRRIWKRLQFREPDPG